MDYSLRNKAYSGLSERQNRRGQCLIWLGYPSLTTPKAHRITVVSPPVNHETVATNEKTAQTMAICFRSTY